MNIGFWQILFIVLICFLLFGDMSKVIYNINIVLHKLEKIFNNNKDNK